ncbi:hypothetical protein Cst04h_03370 [Corynebacterium striatum]|uniref:Uncharacterized protein n=1 Tax=Corynebacterium striatum TaxID=43770 RepID=A0ABC9ZJ75_CORST|nr:hypothetical protein Cst04h_03370 [Corynebacterium striatum]
MIDSRKRKAVIPGTFKFWFYPEDDVARRRERDDTRPTVFFLVKTHRYVPVKVSKDKTGARRRKEREGLFNFLVKSPHKWFELIGRFHRQP